MVEVQKAELSAVLNSSNPFFSSKYADLGEVWRVARAVLPANGIAVFQIPSYENGNVQVSTMLVHTSGQWISGTVSLRPAKQDPQGFGSCITYARRYGLASMVGIVADTDDDANAASAPVVAESMQESAEYQPVPMTGGGEDPDWSINEPAPAPTLPPNEWWNEVIMPLGKDKGKTLGQLPKNTLWYWWLNYRPKPYKGAITPADANLRRALDAAGARYSFKPGP